jgi:ergot alkaloid biosynthesis protein
MTILVTGGTGKVGRRLVLRLRRAGVGVRIASPRPQGTDAIAFDWNVPATWDAALNGISAAYLIPPPTGGDASSTMIDFVQLAVAGGVKRFVLQSASLLPAGGPAAGRVHQWLLDNAEGWAVLRPSWFMQNFSEGRYLDSIREANEIYSAAGDGRVPFINADDIAASACAALTAAKAPNADFILTGPQAITYDDAAASLSQATGRTIIHRRISVVELAAQYAARGMPPGAAQILAGMDTMIAMGMENRTTDAVQTLTGHPSSSFDAFAKANAALWM